MDRLSELKAEKQGGKRIVFTNGCFDILHIGHLRYLAGARALGDLLVVGLNSDSSVRRLKGPGRPIIPESERAEMLCGLKAVDYVLIFNEDTPLELIKQIRPDVLVKGGDWAVDQIVGADVVREYNGLVTTIPLVTGRSTTSIVERILADAKCQG